MVAENIEFALREAHYWYYNLSSSHSRARFTAIRRTSSLSGTLA
jgi:hypothetical protein